MAQSSRHRSKSRNWAEFCCLGSTCVKLFWSRVVVRKWFNISFKDSDFSGDTSDDDASDAFFDLPEMPRLRRQNSETPRAQSINKKEIRICVGTWNVGGRLPPNDLDIDEWLDISNPADVYVIGLQEIVPLNAGNVFGFEDSGPTRKWENTIREALSRIHSKRKFKSFSDPPSPSKFKPSYDAPDTEDEILLEKYCDVEEVHPVEEDPCGLYERNGNTAGGDGTMIESVALNENASNPATFSEEGRAKQISSLMGLDVLRFARSYLDEENEEQSVPLLSAKLSKVFSGTETTGLSGREPPLNLLAQHGFERKHYFGEKTESFQSSKSVRAYKSFNSMMNNDPSRSEYLRIVSKQMVGIFVTIWVHKGLHKHVKNLKVSTVGVGFLGYIGNKGSVSVSMSIYQTRFCFICTHLTSGEKDSDELKRNADVCEIHRRTRFYHDDGFPQNIHGHERIIWLGDLNYRINMPYQETRDLISKQDWTKLVEKDQLKQELTDGRAFEGWFEGMLDFPPTYKYEPNSDKYYGDDPKAGRRNPAWCDRILSYGNGIELLTYKIAKLQLSDHRPVTATFMVDVEDFCPRKLQRALTFTDAEIEKRK